MCSNAECSLFSPPPLPLAGHFLTARCRLFSSDFHSNKQQQPVSSSWDGRPFDQNRRAENWGLCTFWGGGARSPSNTMWPSPKPTFIPSGILIHPAIRPQQTWAENWGVVPLLGVGLGLHLTQCSQGRGLPDNFPSYPPDNHHCSNDVYLRGRGNDFKRTISIRSVNKRTTFR